MNGELELRGEGGNRGLNEVLASLKERGCTILVSGDVPVPTSRLVSRRLFGHPVERRERVLLRLRQTNTLEDWFPPDVDLETRGVRVVDCTDPGRSATDEDNSFRCRWDSEFDPEETPALTRWGDIGDCTDEIDSIAGDAGPLAPSQLRVGVFSLDVLTTPARMVEVASAVSETVVEHRGMVHYHLQQPPSREIDQRLLDLADATVSVRKQAPGKPAEQKWTVSEYGETPWVRLRRYE